jgi:hypothetical protein
VLDTFAKRVNSQLRPYPGDIDAGDRWAIGGRVRPTAWAAGAVVAGLGALVADFPGTFEAPPVALMTQGDRWRAELYPLPGDIAVYNRHAVAGHFLFEGADVDDVAGAIEVTLGGLDAGLIGTFTIPGRDGDIVATLGALDLSFVGTAFYDLFFDIAWALTPNFGFTEQPQRSGAIATTLGGLSSSITGTSLPPDSVSGRISTSLGALAGGFLGTHQAPAAIDGLVHVDFSLLSASFMGTAVPVSSNVGAVQATLGALSASFVGTFENWSTDGYAEMFLGDLDTTWYGQFIQAGAIVGLINGPLGELTGSFSGLLDNDPGYLKASKVRIVPGLQGETQIVPGLDGVARVRPDGD